jgi:hypothetical protein
MLAEYLFSLEFLRFLPDSVVANNLLHPAVSGRRYERAAPVLQRRQFSTLNTFVSFALQLLIFTVKYLT